MNNKHWIKNLFGAIAIPLLVAILLQGLCIIKGRTMIANMTSFDNFVVYSNRNDNNHCIINQLK